MPQNRCRDAEKIKFVGLLKGLPFDCQDLTDEFIKSREAAKNAKEYLFFALFAASRENFSYQFFKNDPADTGAD
jgi:hypothetical protein